MTALSVRERENVTSYLGECVHPWTVQPRYSDICLLIFYKISVHQVLSEFILVDLFACAAHSLECCFDVLLVLGLG